jgi:hypothetical protein
VSRIEFRLNSRNSLWKPVRIGTIAFLTCWLFALDPGARSHSECRPDAAITVALPPNQTTAIELPRPARPLEPVVQKEPCSQ